MRVLLFGATGFLGRHIRDGLADREVLCPQRTECDLARVTVPDLTDLVRAARPDAVLYCAGRLDGTGSELTAVHAVGTAKVIEAVAAGAPRARLVRIGSAAEYGRIPFGHAVSEAENCAPVSTYGLSHFTGTRLVELAAAAGRVDGVVLRVFNPVGPGLPATTVLGRAARLIAAAVAARSLPAAPVELGPLDAWRDFVDVRDVAAAVRAATDAPESTDRVVNVASGRAVEIRTAVDLLARAAGFDGGIRAGAPVSGRSADVPWMCGDPSRAARVLRWAPGYDLAESVKAMWAEPVAARLEE